MLGLTHDPIRGGVRIRPSAAVPEAIAWIATGALAPEAMTISGRRWITFSAMALAVSTSGVRLSA